MYDFLFDGVRMEYITSGVWANVCLLKSALIELQILISALEDVYIRVSDICHDRV